MKKLYITFSTILGNFYSLIASAKTSNNYLIENMAPEWDSIIVVDKIPTDWSGLSFLDWILKILRDTTFWVLPTVAILVFLFIWMKLFLARWDQEEFKKSLMWFIYAAIGLTIVPMAWWIIYLITTLNI